MRTHSYESSPMYSAKQTTIMLLPDPSSVGIISHSTEPILMEQVTGTLQRTCILQTCFSVVMPFGIIFTGKSFPDFVLCVNTLKINAWNKKFESAPANSAVELDFLMTHEDP